MVDKTARMHDRPIPADFNYKSAVNISRVDGIKFHHLQVIRNTTLAEQYALNQVAVYDKAGDYIPILCDCIETLSPEIVIHRLASQATSRDLLIAPCWPESAGEVALMGPPLQVCCD